MIAQHARPNPFFRAGLLAAALLIGLWAAMVTMLPLPKVEGISDHAVLVHGEDAVRAKQCLDDSHKGFMFYNPRSNRYAVACWLGDRWGIIILTAAWVVITSFVTKRLKTAERVRDYFRRQGYE